MAGGEGTPLLPRPSATGREPNLFARLRERLFQPNHQYFEHQHAFESLDYEQTESIVEMEHRRSITLHEEWLKDITRWAIMFLIGVLTGIVAFLIDFCIVRLANFKFSIIGDSVDR